MPAFGVSLNDETIQAKQTGVWIELFYETTCLNNEMPFDSLLIQVEPENTGFNVIRKYDDKYDGRCFYIDLKGQGTQPKARTVANGRRAKFTFEIEGDEDGADYWEEKKEGNVDDGI